jgi:alcohol dehydrogenase
MARLITMAADAEPISVSLIDLISKRIRIIGSQLNGPECLFTKHLISWAQGEVKAIVETYPLAEPPKAYDRVRQGQARFRAVLTMYSPIRAVGCLFRVGSRAKR